MNNCVQWILLHGRGHAEILLTLQEKRPLFRVIERGAQIDIDLAGIGLHLAEIRVVGGVEREVRGDAQLSGEAEVELAVVPLPDTITLQVALAEGHRRQDLVIALIFDVGQDHFPHLSQHGAAVGPEFREEGLLGLAHDHPYTHDTHGEFFFERVADALEGDSHFGCVAVIADFGSAVPDHVVICVAIAVLVEHAVHLDAAWVYHKNVAVLLVVESIDGHTDPIIAVDVVAPGHGGLDLARFNVQATESKIDVFPVIGHVDLGFFRNRLAIIGLGRLEIAPGLGRLPDGIIEHTVDFWRYGSFGKLKSVRCR